jgi:hypothetical protein
MGVDRPTCHRVRNLDTRLVERTAQSRIAVRRNGFTGLCGPTGCSGDEVAAASLFGGAAWA